MKSPIYILHPGRTPLLVSLPHAGTGIPAPLLAAMQPPSSSTWARA
jgi:N-formylglutamate amidohydrolase